MIDLLLGSWIVVTLGLYRCCDGRVATLVAMLGGWALLPNEVYSASAVMAGENTNSVHALAIASSPWWNKATVIGLACLLGSVLFDWRSLSAGGRPRWYDGPMIAWCLAPLASALANGFPLAEGLNQVRYLSLAWGVPYLLGRSLFATPTALNYFARAWTLAGLVTLPLALVEFVRGPWFYHFVYGFHPYRESGANRMIGHRPFLFLEAGNQFGMWAATAAIAASWVWATGPRRPLQVGRFAIPAGLTPLVLVASCILWQSHTAIVLLLLGLAPLAIHGHLGSSGRKLVLTCLVLVGLAGLAAVAWIAVRSGGDPRTAARTLFHGIGKSSFTWRMARVADYLPRIAERPWLGWGQADWSGSPRGGIFADPIAMSVAFLAAGMYGVLGLVAVLVVVLVPVVGAIARLRKFDWTSSTWGGVSASTAILAVNVADLPMNSILLLPVLLAAGGLNAWCFGPAGLIHEGRADDRGSMTYSVPGFGTRA